MKISRLQHYQKDILQQKSLQLKAFPDDALFSSYSLVVQTNLKSSKSKSHHLLEDFWASELGEQLAKREQLGDELVMLGFGLAGKSCDSEPP